MRPAAMAKFLATARTASRRPLDTPRISTIVDAYEDWTDVVGGRYLARRLQATLRTCAAIRDQVTASYAIGSRPTSWGKWLWVALRVENRTDQRRYVQIHGTYWAGGLRPEAQEPYYYDRGRNAWQQAWGGSSMDASDVKPGETLTLGDFALPADSGGSVGEVRPEISVDGCSLPVVQDS